MRESFARLAACWASYVGPTYILRYVDDLACFSDSKRQLWQWKAAIIERLARLRLVLHETAAQVVPVETGIPWLGFVVYPTHRRVKARKVRNAHRRLRDRLAAYHAGAITYAELDAAIRGWIAHVGHADSWGLRGHVLDTLVIQPAEHRRALARNAERG
ncbi:RNA-directed DNA polymerase [Thioflavicoccus mobilis]|uniref:RNA-directed DNA polymerase n=1 Tax=Thioflavicoccus mobilis TaxID=80679 RepID=UPI00030D395E|nr:RNA-directed DNA polymerase [Thioflavicoccus mobilis]